MIADKQMKCCICETEIDNGMDYHNPAPLGKSGDVCCTYCNITKVLPVRIEQTRKITEKMSKILVNINKQISLLNNNEINSVIQMIKNRRTELSMAAGSKLSVGQKVQFSGRGMIVKGRLTKINQKTAIVSESNSPKQWKVSISLLEAA